METAIFGGSMLFLVVLMLCSVGAMVTGLVGGTALLVWLYRYIKRDLAEAREKSIGREQGGQPIQAATGSVLDTQPPTGDNPRR